MSLSLGLGLTLANRGGGAPAFVPGDISGLILALLPGVGITTSSGEVTGWADQSGVGDTGRNFAPVTDKPAYNAVDASYNNRPTVGTFNKAGSANNCKLRSGTWNTTYSSDTTPFTILIVGHSLGTSNRYFCNESGSDRIAIANIGDGVNQVAAQSGGATPALTPTGQMTSPSVAMAEYNGASSKIWVNKFETPSATGNLATSTLGNASYNIGSYGAADLATTFGVERVAMLLAYSKALSLAERQQLRAYVNTLFAFGIST